MWTPFTVEKLGNKFKDIRQTIPGNSETWATVQPLKYFIGIAVHHTAGPDTQTPEQIANYHINNNGWGGIGYHFLVDKEGIVYYVGDLSTARAHVANRNDQYLGVCAIGNFVNVEPSEKCKYSIQELCRKIIQDYPPLEGIQNWNQVKGHKEVPEQSTACPAKLMEFVTQLREKNGNVLADGGVDCEQQIKALTRDLDKARALIIAYEEDKQYNIKELLTAQQEVKNLIAQFAAAKTLAEEFETRYMDERERHIRTQNELNSLTVLYEKLSTHCARKDVTIISKDVEIKELMEASQLSIKAHMKGALNSLKLSVLSLFKSKR